MGVFSRMRNLLTTYPKMLWLLAIGCFLNIAGLSFLWPLNSIYIHEELGRPLTVAGIVLMLHSAGASLGYLVGGTLFDKIGARPVLLGSLLASACVVALPGVITNFPLYVAVMLVFGFTASLTFPALNAFAAKVWPEGGRRAFNFLYVANNVGVAVGTALGGLVAQQSFKLAFFSASGSLLIFLLFAYFKIHDPQPQNGGDAVNSTAEAAPLAKSASELPPPEPKIPWFPIGSLFVAFLILWIVYVQWQTSIAVFLQEEGIPLSQYSLLWTINGVLIFCGQPLIALLVRVLPSPSSQMFLGTGLFVASYALILSGGDRFPIFVMGMIILTLGEMLLWPAVPAAVSSLSPPSRAGFLQGIIGSAATFGRMLGPLIGGLFYDHTSFPTLLTFMLAMLLIPLIGFTLYAKTSSSPSTRNFSA